MNDEVSSDRQGTESTAKLRMVSDLTIPSIANSLKQVYATGSIPLALIFVATVVIFWLLVQGTLAALPYVGYLIGSLLAAGVLVFMIINWLAYKQWKDEVNARLENRRLETDLIVKLAASARETQDAFLLEVLKYTGQLSGKEGSTPEGRKAEIEFLSQSLGSIIKEFVELRSKLELPELTAAFPQNRNENAVDHKDANARANK